MLGLKMGIARGVGAVARASGRGGGTSLPGKVLLRLEPAAIGELARRLPGGSAVISATNGKTTTAAMCATILGRSGARLVHNRAGANMAGGIASTLLAAAGTTGAPAGDLGLFEVDEFWLATVTADLQPRAVLLANLFRDQLDRYGELETIADRWAQVAGDLPAITRLVLNTDDPLIADLGRERAQVTYYGIEDDAMSIPDLQHASDSKHCRRCGAPYRYDQIYLGHLGHYHCESCGRSRPAPTVIARDITLHGTRSATFELVSDQGSATVELSLPGLYNVYNAVGAAALCLALGISFDDVVSGLEATSPAFGRSETLLVDGSPMQMLLIKNPAGANEVLRTLVLETEQLHLLVVLNDQIADGRDVSWIWDADFEMLASRVGSVVCAGSRAAEMAVRLKYAGVPGDRLNVVPELAAALDVAVAQADGRRIYALPTYTAMLGLREELQRQGFVNHFWEARA